MLHRLLDALFGERHKLARDFAGASLLIAVAAVGSAHVLARGVETRVFDAKATEARKPERAETRLVSRSVLDDPLITGSVGVRPVLDPCAAPKAR